MRDDAADEAPRRGRPRSEASHRAVLVAAAELLEEMPYEDITVEGIAAAAGVGKQTIYRWWSNKSAVVLEAFLAGHIDSNFAPIPDTGDLRADLTSWMAEAIRVGLSDNALAIARSLLSAMLHSGDRAGQLVEDYRVWDRGVLAERIRAEVSAGRVRADVDPDIAAAALIDPVILRIIAEGEPDQDWGRALVLTVLDGITSSD